MNKFEQLIEYIINEDEAKAKALFHRIVVEKSRDIYEGLVDDDASVEAGDGADSFGDEISADTDVIDGDEEGMDNEFGDGDGDEFGGDDMEMGGDVDMSGEGDIEDRVMDLEDAIDELKAEFESLMGGDEEGMGDEFGGDDMGSDEFGGDNEFSGDDAGSDEFGGDDEFDSDEGGAELGDDADADGKKFGEASIYGESKTAKEWTDSKGKKHSGTAVKGEKYDGKAAEKDAKAKKVKESRKSPADLMREYVEKVTAVKPVEGDPIGSGGTKSPINSKSTQIGGKNDMGGSSKNIAQGGYASDRDSNTGPKKPSNAYTKGETKMGQDKYENSPAANTKGYKDKQTAKTKEGSDTNGSQPVVKKSFNPGGTPGFKG